MNEEQSVAAVIAAAEQAAVAGDYVLAERHLREAVSLQEAVLGRVHPDLANTLNNLGVACEQAGKLDESEEAYRRAYHIAQEAFPPGHPFVIRSAENLRDFCEARGRPFDLPPPVVPVQASVPAGTGPVSLGPIRAPGEPGPPARPPAPAPLMDSQPAGPAPVHPRVVVPATEHAPQVTERRSLALPLSALAIVAALVVVWLFVGDDTPAEDSALGSVTVESPATAPPEAGGTSAGSSAVEGSRAQGDAGAAAPPADASAPTTPAPLPVATPTSPRAANPLSASSITIVTADVCRNFLPRSGDAEWR
jgi:hypothetical protein